MRSHLTYVGLALMIFFLALKPALPGEEEPHVGSRAGVSPTPSNDRSGWGERDIAPAAIDGSPSPVRIWQSGPVDEAAIPWFLITHGMGGTEAGDRFHQLGRAIRRRFPRACVVRVDWSKWAVAQIGGLPNPWKVATHIDAAGDRAADILRGLPVEPARMTLIGESFGNWVNARISLRLGGVGSILAMNPASEAGGYAPPDLRKWACHSWSFHTKSSYDTHLEIASSDFWLETPPNADAFAQHVAGIPWLTARIEADDLSWLALTQTLPDRQPGHFQATATQDGRLSFQQLPRVKPR